MNRSLKNKLILLVTLAIVPVLVMNLFLLRFLLSFQASYDQIVRNMTVANSYNLNFKEELDECIYKLVFNGEVFYRPEEKPELPALQTDRNNPYVLIRELRDDFTALEHITTDRDSKAWLSNLLRSIDTLEDRIDDIRENLAEGGHYDENIGMIDNNIYILTELINDDIQYYIHYQTRSIAQVGDTLSGRVRSFTATAAVLTAILLVGLIVTTFLFLRRIIGPLGELTRVTERIAEGDFNARAGIDSRDEIGRVAGSVNDMARHLEVMVGQIKEDERKMRNAELRLLQEQINPHFLYNTLDTIVWLIEGGRSEQAEDVVMSLSAFFRQVLNGGREMITVQDEELHIRSYLQIQQVRYREILDYRIEIDPRLYPYKILKLTLQPLVENALYHGIKPKRAKGLVRILGWLGEEDHALHFLVEDDGVGMQEEELAALREEIGRPCNDENSRGFGMANVNERIRLNFGKEYGISIDSAPGEGTRVWIVLPAVWSGERKEADWQLQQKGPQGNAG